jgi:hypothetical protein
MIDDRGWPPPIFTEKGALEKYLDRIFGKLEEGGKGSGWFAPPKGTHGPGSQGGAAKSDHEYALEFIGKSREHGVAIKDGREVLRKIGEVDYIDFSPSEVALLVDAKMIHNHKETTQLSMDDVSFAIGNNLAEMQAVTYLGHGRYARSRIIRPPGGWPGYGRAGTVIDREHRRIYQENWDLINAGDLTKDQAEKRHLSQLWDAVDDELGFIYEEEVVDFDEDTP